MLERLAHLIMRRRWLFIGAWIVLTASFFVLTAVNVTVPAFSDAARVASGAAIGFALGTLAGLVRYGMPRRRSTPRDR